MTLLVSGIMAIAHLYLGWRMVRATGFLTSKKYLRWLPVLLLLSFYCLPVVGLFIFGSEGSVNILEIPKALTYWFWFGLAFSYQLVSWVIVMDLLKAGFHFGSGLNKERINQLYGRFLVTLGVIMVFYTAVKMYWHTTQIEVQEVELSLEELPASLEGTRIVHISDIQGDQYTGPEKIARYIKLVNAQKPDLVIFTGDLISYGTDYIEMSAEGLSRVKAEFGTYAVVGDHDFWAGLDNVEPALESRGIALLQDENRYVSVGNDSLLLTGITEVYSRRARPEVVRNLMSEQTGTRLKMLASHQVSDLLIEESLKNDYQLFLGGHTHGGQVRIPLFGMTFSASDMETEFVGGLYQRAEMFIHVNNGLGFTLAPVRYNAPPTITVLTLTGSRPKAE